MLGESYRENYDRAYIEDLLQKLAALGPDRVVLSGVSLADGRLGAAAYEKKSGVFSYYDAERIEGYYHGTGDVFGSALLSALMNDRPLSDAIRVAVDFTVGAIRRTKAAGTDIRYGVDFENELPSLLRMLGKN